jgi:hypothetical protein
VSAAGFVLTLAAVANLIGAGLLVREARIVRRLRLDLEARAQALRADDE